MIHYSIGYNFDPALAASLARVNAEHGRRARIDEVFGALSFGPAPSARPQSRIPRLSFDEFEGHVKALAVSGISFNYLLNTAWVPATRDARDELRSFVKEVVVRGVTRFTVGTPRMATLLREDFGQIHLTLSITYGTDTLEHLAGIAGTGIDAIYFDGVTVNRDFALLRTLVGASPYEPRLYANLSCISGCPVVRQHYKIFARQNERSTAQRNDAFFAGCSAVKLAKPVEWLQMPWIRPEDVPVYAEEGITHFKLADRLAATPILVQIAEAYLSGESPADLFTIIERDGAKFRLVAEIEPGTNPITVDTSRIPRDFVEHFRSGACRSRDAECGYCMRVAGEAVTVGDGFADVVVPEAMRMHAPAPLLERSGVPRR